ncbi:MAG: hypothetical protein COW85_09405 [Ignavibacteria bacterium CG22_combo_CG10-13_8_21_14_all_37_15]|nr:MAG: hypothetical protein COW85_09405 [Ignavibacteria bacterium CG22_combo_CG10-13_8_21_14_all_37_15]
MKIRVLNPLPFLIFLAILFSTFSTAQTDSLSIKRKPGVTIGYWNDNFWLDKELNRFFKKKYF